MCARWVFPAVLGLALAAVQPVQAAPGASSGSPSAAPAVDSLPPLSPLPPITRAEADPEAVRAVDGLLARLVSADAEARAAARLELDQVPPSFEPAIHARIQELRESLDRERAPRLLEDARKAARDAKKGAKNDKKGPKPKNDDELDEDWLAFVLARPATKDPAWRDLVRLLASVRMLGAIGTTPAVRDLIELRANFGEMLRVDLQRQVAKLKDRAVPALIEAKKHDAAVVRRFAELELDRLGRAIPGEAAATTDPDVLADTLRAFGHVRDVDAVGVCLSFANHERRKVREAARQAIAGIGEPARWQLRDVFQDLTGEKPDRSVPWDHLARRIFHEYDKARLTEIDGLARAGLEAQSASKWSEAVLAFDKVLARDPLFERRREMANAYFELARTLPFDRGDERLAMLRKARRLDPESPKGAKIDAEISFTEAKILIAEGKPERFLLERTLELDPDHPEVKQLLGTFEQTAIHVEPPWRRYWAAGGVTAVTLVLLAFLAFFKRKPRALASPRAP